MNRQERMKELVELLNKASKAYYQDAEEIMSNYEYDKLYDELQELERELGITLSNSPTVRVGSEVVSELPSTNRVITLSLWAFQGQFTVDIPGILAAVVVSVIPILTAYIIGRKQMVAGLTAGFSK